MASFVNLCRSERFERRCAPIGSVSRTMSHKLSDWRFHRLLCSNIAAFSSHSSRVWHRRFFAGLKGIEMVAIVFSLFGVCCTFLAAASVIFFGVSVSYIVNMYFVYLTLTAVAVVAVPGARFLFSFFQECTESLRRTDETAARRRSLPATLSPLP